MIHVLLKCRSLLAGGDEVEDAPVTVAAYVAFQVRTFFTSINFPGFTQLCRLSHGFSLASVRRLISSARDNVIGISGRLDSISKALSTQLKSYPCDEQNCIVIASKTLW